MFRDNGFKVECEKAIFDDVKKMLEDGFSKQGYNDVVSTRDGILFLKDLMYVHQAVLEDGKVVYIDGNPREKVGPSDVFKMIKKVYPDVELGGVLEIGDDNYRETYIFNSHKGSQDILEDYAYYTDNDEWAPVSEAWFYYVANSDYGPVVIVYETKAEFKEFWNELKEQAEENEMDLEEFFETDEFIEFLSDNEYDFPEDEDERTEFWQAVMKKYKGKK